MLEGPWLRHRAEADELMDDLASGGEELREAHAHLRRLNKLFAASAPTLYGVNRLWRKAGCPDELSILDVGAGSGDVNRRLLGWGAEHGVRMRIMLLDVTEEACEEAALYYKDEPRVEVRRGDVLKLPGGCADIVTGTQFLHHFQGERLHEVVGSMVRASRYGVVINDIHRHWLAWIAVWLAARLLSRNRYIRHDGPLSVAKGFRSSDWHSLENAAGEGELRYCWRPLFRYAVMIRKGGDGYADGL
ncbi:methyltransferase domain-containing protein [Paenibacillus sp. J5C_2022]|uniref:methyltransferase domain-containing protein n=1 Tax=Paenibacillus sp. J5C2022 TaxID=2977129 RepID=UPI0021D31F25|nr:methyltransferase domain-containing protein [Paenibacillus sp. J5C2022]MCU6711731.1 methyltransferase domain-containing protein [Paenibacillus sp. J5C2022]